MIAFFLHILCYDIWFYISHRLLHSKTLWKYHKIHHEIIHPKFTDTYKGHWAEGPFQSIGFLAPLLFVEFNIISFATAFVFVNVRGMARHDDRIAWLIGNHHLLHHIYFTSNYGEFWLDSLCGTLIKDKTKIQKGPIYV